MINQTVVDNPVFAAFVSVNREGLAEAIRMFEEDPKMVRNYFANVRKREMTLDELRDLCDTIRATLEKL